MIIVPQHHGVTCVARVHLRSLPLNSLTHTCTPRPDTRLHGGEGGGAEGPAQPEHVSLLPIDQGLALLHCISVVLGESVISRTHPGKHFTTLGIVLVYVGSIGVMLPMDGVPVDDNGPSSSNQPA